MDYADHRAKCPYFRKEERIVICCEGIEPETVLRQVFPNKDDLRAFRKRNCDCYPNDCPIARELDKKWDFEGVR